MKKMPCLFQRDFTDSQNPVLLNTVTPGCEWVLKGAGYATRKWDGTACMLKDGQLFKRYDAKRGKTPPPGFIEADVPDPVTGHYPGWLPVNIRNPDSADVWIVLAWHHPRYLKMSDGTYEAIGPKINGNPEGIEQYEFLRHGLDLKPYAPRTFEGLQEYLAKKPMEGLVFWRSKDLNCDKVKIRRRDFGFPWPMPK